MKFCCLFHPPSRLRSAGPCGECGARFGAEKGDGDLPQLADHWNCLLPSRAPARCRGLRACQATSSSWFLQLSCPAGALLLPVLCPALQARSYLIQGLVRERVSRVCPCFHHSGACGSSFSSHLHTSAVIPNLCMRASVHPFDPICKLEGAGKGFCEPSKASVIRWEALKTDQGLCDDGRTRNVTLVLSVGHEDSLTLGVKGGVPEGGGQWLLWKAAHLQSEEVSEVSPAISPSSPQPHTRQ